MSTKYPGLPNLSLLFTLGCSIGLMWTLSEQGCPSKKPEEHLERSGGREKAPLSKEISQNPQTRKGEGQPSSSNDTATAEAEKKAMEFIAEGDRLYEEGFAQFNSIGGSEGPLSDEAQEKIGAALRFFSQAFECYLKAEKIYPQERIEKKITELNALRKSCRDHLAPK